MISHPGLPQIRTCAISAYGSSSHGFTYATAHKVPPRTRSRRRSRNCAAYSASLAIRRSLVDTGSGSKAPVMFPSNGSTTRRPLPSPGSPRVRFSWFHGTMRRSDFSPAFPTHFVAFVCGYRVARLAVRSRSVPDAQPTGRGSLGSAAPSHRNYPAETARSPKFLENPAVPAPCSWTPARPTCQATTAGRHGPTCIVLRGLPTRSNFGAR